MSKRFAAGLALLSLTMAACADDSDSLSDLASTQPSETSPQQFTVEQTSTPSSGDAPTQSLIGSWHRAQTCSEVLTAFQSGGLAESHLKFLQENWFRDGSGPSSGDPCAGAPGPLEHDHFFTDAGAFGSHDENGDQVDNGDFVLIDSGKVGFPSHATDFGYDGDLVVDYSIDGDVATFDVAVPAECVDGCADAYAWAFSAFASGPWERGEVP